MCKINAPIPLYYVLFSSRYGLSYLIMWSLRMIMCTFCLVEWSFNLIVRSLYLVTCISHSVHLSFSYNIFFGYVLLSFGSALFYLVMRSCHSVICSFHYSLFLCALIMCSFYALFLCALLMRSFYVLFVFALFMRSCYVVFRSVSESKN